MGSRTDSKCRLIKNKYMGALICSEKDLISALFYLYLSAIHTGKKVLQVSKAISYTLNLRPQRQSRPSEADGFFKKNKTV